MNVVAALIKKNDKYLIAKRATGDSSVLGKWEFPGGKVENNENDERAIKREIKEELDIDIKAIQCLVTKTYEYPLKTITIKLYECEYIKGDIRLKDHSEYRYVKKNDLLKYDLCPADIELAAYVKGIGK